MAHFIHYCDYKESKEFAAQIMGGGYIPWAPHAGRHIMNDFGELIEALPQDYYDEQHQHLSMWWDCYRDQTYLFH